MANESFDKWLAQRLKTGRGYSAESLAEEAWVFQQDKVKQAVASERARCAKTCNPSDFEKGSSEWCALFSTQFEILAGDQPPQPDRTQTVTREFLPDIVLGRSSDGKSTGFAVGVKARPNKCIRAISAVCKLLKTKKIERLTDR